MGNGDRDGGDNGPERELRLIHTAEAASISMQEGLATPEDAADFLLDMIRELEEIAQRHGHKVLGQILQIAYIEARRVVPEPSGDREAG